MPLDSNEDDLIRDLLEQADAEAQQESISSFATEWGFGLGCGLGCLMGPIVGFALLWLDAFLRPDLPGGGPGGLVIFLGQVAVVSSIVGSQLIPFLLRRRNRKRH